MKKKSSGQPKLLAYRCLRDSEHLPKKMFIVSKVFSHFKSSELYVSNSASIQPCSLRTVYRKKKTFLELFLIAFKMFLIRVEKILWNLPLQFSKCFVQNLYLKTYSRVCFIKNRSELSGALLLCLLQIFMKQTLVTIGFS